VLGALKKLDFKKERKRDVKNKREARIKKFIIMGIVFYR
jgi:hypothetical protein